MSPRSDGSLRAYLAGCFGLIGFLLGYTLPAFAKLPNLIYHPLERRFFVGVRPGPIPLGYYGQCLYGVAGALLAIALVWVVTSLVRRAPSPSTIGLAAAWTLTLSALVGAYFTWNNWP